jgi:circadian clock protein KaiB
MTEAPFTLKLFVAGNSELCRAALRNLKLLTAEYLPTNSNVEVVDILQKPDEAERHSVLAIPMLVRCEPLPMRRIIGDLANMKRVLVSLGLNEAWA